MQNVINNCAEYAVIVNGKFDPAYTFADISKATKVAEQLAEKENKKADMYEEGAEIVISAFINDIQIPIDEGGCYNILIRKADAPLWTGAFEEE